MIKRTPPDYPPEEFDLDEARRSFAALAPPMKILLLAIAGSMVAGITLLVFGLGA